MLTTPTRIGSCAGARTNKKRTLNTYLVRIGELSLRDPLLHHVEQRRGQGSHLAFYKDTSHRVSMLHVRVHLRATWAFAQPWDCPKPNQVRSQGPTADARAPPCSLSVASASDSMIRRCSMHKNCVGYLSSSKWCAWLSPMHTLSIYRWDLASIRIGGEVLEVHIPERRCRLDYCWSIIFLNCRAFIADHVWACVK